MRNEAAIIQCFSPAKPCAVLLLNHSYCTFLVYLPPWRGDFLTDLKVSEVGLNEIEVAACYFNIFNMQQLASVTVHRMTTKINCIKLWTNV